MHREDKPTATPRTAQERIRHLPIMDKQAHIFTYPMALAALLQGANALAEIARERDQLERELAFMTWRWELQCNDAENARKELAETRKVFMVCYDLLNRFGVYAPNECQDEINLALKNAAPQVRGVSAGSRPDDESPSAAAAPQDDPAFNMQAAGAPSTPTEKE